MTKMEFRLRQAIKDIPTLTLKADPSRKDRRSGQRRDQERPDLCIRLCELWFPTQIDDERVKDVRC